MTQDCTHFAQRGRITVLSYHLLWRRMLSSVVCTGQAHSPFAARLPWAGTCPPSNAPSSGGSGLILTIHGYLDPHKTAPKTESGLVQPFLHSSPVCQTHIQMSKLRCFKGGGSLWTQISGGKGRPSRTIFGTRKVESLSYRMVKKNCRKVQPPE